MKVENLQRPLFEIVPMAANNYQDSRTLIQNVFWTNRIMACCTINKKCYQPLGNY